MHAWMCARGESLHKLSQSCRYKGQNIKLAGTRVKIFAELAGSEVMKVLVWVPKCQQISFSVK